MHQSDCSQVPQKLRQSDCLEIHEKHIALYAKTELIFLKKIFLRKFYDAPITPTKIFLRGEVLF